MAVAARRRRARHRAPGVAPTLAAGRGRRAVPAPLRLRHPHAGDRRLDAHAGRLLLRALHRGGLGPRPAGDARGRRRRRAAHVRLAHLAVRGRQWRRGGDEPRRPAPRPGRACSARPPPTSSTRLLINVVYFGGAIIGGQAAWRAALQRDRLAEQARTIDAQATSLQRQAVVEERLRIARELHDVVAHHVSVIGIQAAAARRVLRRDAEAAEAALRSVETSSREAVTQMRELLGTLRVAASDEPAPTAPGRPSRGSPTCPPSSSEVATAGARSSSATSSRTPRRGRRRAGPGGALALPHRAGGAGQHPPALDRLCRNGFRPRRPPSRARLRPRLRRGRGARRRPSALGHVRHRPRPARRPRAPRGRMAASARSARA